MNLTAATLTIGTAMTLFIGVPIAQRTTLIHHLIYS